MLWALIGAVAIGLSLGLMGSGGSILTVPVLTYLVGQTEKVAIAGSLAIVGTISAVAGIPYLRRHEVDLRSLLYFGLPGMAGAWIGALLSRYVSGGVQLSVFAVLMLLAGFSMLRPMQPASEGGTAPRAAWKIVIEGLLVGAVTGFVGVGGGFLIVPALVLLGGLSMTRAVGTSLFIIALKSFTGFVKYLDVLDELDLHLDWRVLATFAALGIVGSFGGSAIGARVSQQRLRRGFAAFLFAVGAFIVMKSWPGLFAGSSHAA